MLFELLGWISEARRQIAHVSEVTGLSVITLIILVALAYLEPTIRKWCVRGAIVVIVLYLTAMYFYGLGNADKAAEWLRANIRAQKQAQVRDDSAAKDAGADAASRLRDLQAQIQRDQEQINALRNADATCHPITRDQLR